MSFLNISVIDIMASCLIRTENYETNTEEKILVKDVMTHPLITVKEDTCMPMVAKLMEHCKIGSVVVTSEKGKPLGIITERDLVVRILTKIALWINLNFRGYRSYPDGLWAGRRLMRG